jgi:uncharacterized protein (TIGR04551 family)
VPGVASLGTTRSGNNLTYRNYKTYIFDPWIKFGVGHWLFEAEAVGVVGSMNVNPSTTVNNVTFPGDAAAPYCQVQINGSSATCQTGSINIRQFGGVARGTYFGLDGKLRFSFEGGYASGDQYDSEDYIGGKLTSVPGETNVSHARMLPLTGDTNMTRFIFDRDYKVDLILFRHLLGAVSNAIYLKPKLEYDLSRSFVFRVWNVTSFAARPVATPGNGQMYGIEFDGDLGYQSSSFFAGFAYGALFPLGAMSHPSTSSSTGGGPGFNYTDNTGDGQTAHTIQMRLVVKF